MSVFLFGRALVEQNPQYIKVIYNSQEDWSAKVVESATIKDLDSEAIFLARAKFKEKMVGKPFFDDIDRWSDETFLDKARITLNGKITNTAIILLGKHESSHYILPSVAQITWKLDTLNLLMQSLEDKEITIIIPDLEIEVWFSKLNIRSRKELRNMVVHNKVATAKYMSDLIDNLDIELLKENDSSFRKFYEILTE